MHATEAIDGSCKKWGAMVLYKEAREWWLKILFHQQYGLVTYNYILKVFTSGGSCLQILNHKSIYKWHPFLCLGLIKISQISPEERHRAWECIWAYGKQAACIHSLIRFTGHEGCYRNVIVWPLRQIGSRYQNKTALNLQFSLISLIKCYNLVGIDRRVKQLEKKRN